MKQKHKQAKAQYLKERDAWRLKLKKRRIRVMFDWMAGWGFR